MQNLLTALLGSWLIGVSLTFYDFSVFLINDLVCGFLLLLCAYWSVKTSSRWPGSIVALLGVWLQAAPLLIIPSFALFYLNDTLIGALTIIVAFLLLKSEKKQNDASHYPQGWSYNPSSWKHRIPVVFLAMLCWFFARYMAAYQLGYISHIWDPFFPDGTLRVITSDVSRAFPVSDAGLGALCYTLETLLGWQGDEQRFATMPWLVLSFAFLVIPVGAVSILLIILQPIIVGAWCSWCLATALCMLCMIVLTAGEFIAALQYLPKKNRDTVSMPNHQSFGVTFPWNLIACALLGLVLMFTPHFLTLQGPLATNDYIIGPITFALSVICMAEVFRALRYLICILGIGLLMAPWLFSASSSTILISHFILGLLLLILSLRKGPIKERYGPWQRFIV